MTSETYIFLFALALTFYTAWNMGANDVANAMGTSVGSGALTLKKALIVAAVLEFSGAFFVGTEVSTTIESGILDTTAFAERPQILMWGMLASLLAAGIWLQIASYFGWPVSTTHSLIGALIGFGLIVGGTSVVLWGQVLFIIASWIVSPLLGGFVAYLVFTLIRKKILGTATPLLRSKQMAPYFVFVVMAILTMVIVFQGLAPLYLDFSFFSALALSLGVGIVSFLITRYLLKRYAIHAEGQQPPAIQAAISVEDQSHLRKAIRHLEQLDKHASPKKHDQVQHLLHEAKSLSEEISPKVLPVTMPQYFAVERLFAVLQILTACCMAFAHGANDVANAIGPFAVVLAILKTNAIPSASSVPPWILALGGIGIVFGLATWGWRVIETIGRKITELTPTRGFSAEFGASITILLASKLGLPISTTHTLVGAVLGVGLARGIDALNLGMIKDIILSWIVTIPAGAILSIALYYGFATIFNVV